MNSPNCPDHGRLVLDLALGRLDDPTAAEAEGVSETCPVCRAWWQERFEGEAADSVDEAVAATINDLQLPVRRRGHGWMAVAAAVAMAFGATALWLARDPGVVEPVVVERTAAIQSLDFEVPEDLVVHAVSTSAAVQEPEAVAVETVPESTEAPVPREAVIAETTHEQAPVIVDPEPLFAGGFESGDLSEWVPST